VGGNTIQTGVRKVLGSQTVQPFDEIDPSSYDVKSRLALMDEMGVYAQVLYAQRRRLRLQLDVRDRGHQAAE
jgi:hypothetical protein